MKSLSSLHLFEECGLSTLESTDEDVRLSSRSICEEHDSALSCQYGHCISPLPSRLQTTIQSPPVWKNKEEEELFIGKID